VALQAEPFANLNTAMSRSTPLPVSSALYRRWQCLSYLAAAHSHTSTHLRDRHSQHQANSRCQTASSALISFHKAVSGLVILKYSPLTLPRHPNRQYRIHTAYKTPSTLTKTMEINYLGIMIGFPVLLGFALTTLCIRYYFMKQEMRNIRTRNEMEMNRVHEDERDPPRAPEV
jgi:hypothetical protein